MAQYTEYHPLKFWLDPASIAEIVAHIQTYLVANPINSITEIETIIHDYLIAHPELIGGVDSVNGQTGEVVLTADNISGGENVTIKDVLDSLQDQIDDIVASIPSDYQQLINDVSNLNNDINVLSNIQNMTEFDAIQLSTSVNPTGWRIGIWGDEGRVVADTTSICLTGRIGNPGGNNQRLGMRGLYIKSSFGTIQLKRFINNVLVETITRTNEAYIYSEDGDMLSVSIINLNSPSSDYIANDDIAGIHIYLLFKQNTKKEYVASDYFYVSINKKWIDGNADSVDAVNVDCVLKLPKNYSPGGAPVRLIFMHHGNSGTVNVENKTWYSEVGSWTQFVNAYLNAGYAVFDVNGCGSVTDANASHDYGAFGALQAAYKAYQYIVKNYNVKNKIFVHGSSMGGATAYAFAKIYGNIIGVVGLFAPAFLPRSAQLTSTKEYIAVNYGYSNSSEMESDNYSHLLSATPQMQFFDNGLRVEKAYTYDWINSTEGLKMLCSDFKVPIKIWCGTSDEVVDIQFGAKLSEAIKNAGGLAIYRAVDGVTHTGAIGSSSVINSEAVMWFDRFN